MEKYDRVISCRALRSVHVRPHQPLVTDCGSAAAGPLSHRVCRELLSHTSSKVTFEQATSQPGCEVLQRVMQV